MKLLFTLLTLNLSALATTPADQDYQEDIGFLESIKHFNLQYYQDDVVLEDISSETTSSSSTVFHAIPQKLQDACGFVATEHSFEAETLLKIVELGNHDNYLAASVLFKSPPIAYYIAACRHFTFTRKSFDKELLGLCSKPGRQDFLLRSAKAVLNDPADKQCLYFEIMLRMAFTYESLPAESISQSTVVDIATRHGKSAFSEKEVEWLEHQATETIIDRASQMLLARFNRPIYRPHQIYKGSLTFGDSKMKFFGPLNRYNIPDALCFNLDQCDTQLIHHMIFGDICWGNCETALIERIKDHYKDVNNLKQLPHSVVDSLRIVFTIHQWKILDNNKEVDITPYLPARDGSDALLKSLTAYKMAQNRVLRLPKMEGTLSPPYEKFLKLFAQNQEEFENFLGSLLKDQKTLSEESINTFISSQLSINPPNFEVALAVLAPWRHEVADVLFRAIVARGPVTCNSLTKCKDNLESRRMEIIDRHHEIVEQYNAYKMKDPRPLQMIGVRDALMREYNRRLNLGSLNMRAFFRMVEYLQLATNIHAIQDREREALDDIIHFQRHRFYPLP